jgi:glycosyltransferase involved in cell wall biosynthesis
MKIAFGILAYNEHQYIGKTIASLYGQTLFGSAALGCGVDQIQLLCVPNGCTDDTADEARAALKACPAGLPDPLKVSASVHELAVGDKANAWDVFVHELADPDADYIGLIDGDIQFGSPRTLENMVRLLNEQPEVQVATDRPIKVIPERYRGTLTACLSQLSSSVGAFKGGGICGQLYLARGSCLRSIWLPPGLPIEDGFIAACAVTGGFRYPGEPLSLIRCTNDANHTYEGNATLRDLVRHSKQMMIGSVVNAMLYSYLWANGQRDSVKGLLKPLHDANPHWLSEFVEDEVRRRGRWVIPSAIMHGRFLRLSAYPRSRKVIWFPLVVVGWLFDLYVSFLSNRSFRRGEALRYRWRTVRG